MKMFSLKCFYGYLKFSPRSLDLWVYKTGEEEEGEKYNPFLLHPSNLHFLRRKIIFVAGTVTDASQVSYEEISIKENTLGDFSFQLSTNPIANSKDSTLVIEIKISENGTLHSACNCRWLIETNPVCKKSRNNSFCDVSNSKMHFSLLVRRTYNDIIWECLRQNFKPKILKHTKLQVTCECFFFIWYKC